MVFKNGVKNTIQAAAYNGAHMVLWWQDIKMCVQILDIHFFGKVYMVVDMYLIDIDPIFGTIQFQDTYVG